MAVGVISDTIYHAFSTVTTFISCFSNAFLIYVIVVTKVNHIGPYRWLLLSFAVFDVLLSAVHYLIILFCHITEFGYIVWTQRFVEGSTEIGTWLCMLWVFIFFQSHVILTFHYVYRYVLLCNPTWLTWIQRNPWRNWITIAIMADVYFVGMLCSNRKNVSGYFQAEYGIDLLSPSRPGYVGLNYCIINEDGSRIWLTESVITLGILLGVFISSAAVIAFCLIKIVREMKPANITVSSKSRHMQRQLFRALLWQTFIPACTTYAPIGTILVAPIIFPFALGGLGTMLIMSTQLFPMIDPCLVFFFVHGYRSSLPQFVQRALVVKKTTIVAHSDVPSAFTSAALTN